MSTATELQVTALKLDGSWAELEKETFALTGCIKQDKGAVKNFNVTIKDTRLALRPYLLEMRERINSQGARNDKHPDTPKVGWQQYVRDHKADLGMSLATANRICGDVPVKNPVKVKAGMLISIDGEKYEIAVVNDVQPVLGSKPNNTFTHYVDLKLKLIEEPSKIADGRKGHVLYAHEGRSYCGKAVRKTVPGVAGNDPDYQILEESSTQDNEHKVNFVTGFSISEANRDLVMARMTFYGKCSHNLTKKERVFLNNCRWKGIEGLDKIWPECTTDLPREERQKLTRKQCAANRKFRKSAEETRAAMTLLQSKVKIKRLTSVRWAEEYQSILERAVLGHPEWCKPTVQAETVRIANMLHARRVISQEASGKRFARALERRIDAATATELEECNDAL